MHQLEEVKKTYDKTARAYAAEFSRELESKPLDRLLLQRFSRNAAALGKTVDFGTGCGHTAKYVHDNGATDILGTDISSEMIAVASENYPDVEYAVANMLDTDFEDDSIGSILAFYSIVHFNYTEIEAAFKEFFRILSDGGQLLFSFHVGEEKTELDEFLGVATRITFYYFDVDHIHRVLNSAGFEITETLIRYPYDDVEYPSKRAYISAKKPKA